MSLIFTSIYYAMLVGVALCCILFVPYPRFIRRPLVHGLELILTNDKIKYVEMALLSMVSFVFVNSLQSSYHHHSEVKAFKAQKNTPIQGATVLDVEKRIASTKLLMFMDQRNTYLSGFTLMLYFIVFTYLFSLKKYEKLHDEVKQEQEQSKQAKPKSASNDGVTPTDQQKPKKD